MKDANHSNALVELPNFCLPSVGLRVVLTAEAALVATVIARVSGTEGFMREFLALSYVAQPALLLTLAALCLAGRWLRRLPYQRGVLATLLLSAAVPMTVVWLMDVSDVRRVYSPLFAGGFSLFLTAMILDYFSLRLRALAPAIAEARLTALQSRIRPHFLFNSLNAVLSLVRSDPRRAEAALESLADLFRASMADANRLVRLEDEFALTRAYLDLESLRLGDRLAVRWDTDALPPDAPIPPLVLQPLVENAVYHGIEPRTEGGTIEIVGAMRRGKFELTIRNPLARHHPHRKGNHIALANIRERLMLHFDLDARLESQQTDTTHEVHIVWPDTREFR